MLDKEKLLQFLLKARTKTYARAGGKVRSVLLKKSAKEKIVFMDNLRTKLEYK